MSKVLKYITISFLLIIGLFCAGVLFLFFIPGSSLFKITYINHHLNANTESYQVSDVSKIQINTNAFDIKIFNTNENEIYAKSRSNSFGFTKTTNSSFSVQSSLENSILSFTVNEPKGFCASNSSYIEVYIPANTNIDLTINNTKSKTTIDATNLSIKNLNYSTTKGDLKIVNATLSNKLTLTLGKSDCSISSEVITNNNDVDLHITTGSFKALNSVLGDINILSNTRGVIELNQCADIRENQKTAGGRIVAQKVEHINITAGDTNISIQEIQIDAVVELTASGSIYINELYKSSTIKTNSGNIYVNNAYATLILTSQSGNIQVDNATLIVSVSINYGEALINFNPNAEGFIENNRSRVLNATIFNGTLTATGVEHIGDANSTEGIKITGNGRAHINMRNVYGTNTILANNGRASVVVDKSSAFTLKTSSTYGNVRVNLTQISEYNGYTTKEERTTFVNSYTASSNKLEVKSTGGEILVLDTNFA